jgi:hypothetical protein
LARADIDHVYHRCRKGLIDNLRLLKRLYDHLYTNGRPSRDGRLRLLGVSKAYDDDLYAYGVGRFPEEFDGLELTKITETITSYTTLTHTIPRTTYLASYYTETTTIAHLTTQTKTTTTTRLLTSTSIVESTKTILKEEMLPSPYTLILFILLGLAIGVVSTMLLYRKK